MILGKDCACAEKKYGEKETRECHGDPLERILPLAGPPTMVPLASNA